MGNRKRVTERSEKLTYGPLAVDLAKRQVFLGGTEIQLTAKEFFLLRLFVLNPGKTFTKDELLNQVWGYDFEGDAQVVEVHLSRLRKKLSKTRDFQLIRTVRGIGYKSDFSGIAPIQAAHNLPLQLSSFIGRGKEIAEIQHYIENNRCVTLTGTAGVGKTRLALKASEGLLPEFTSGAWFVRLESLTSGPLIPQTAAAAMGLIEERKTLVSKTLLDYLHSKKLLLILDNCEHLLEACVRFVEEILQSASGVHVLATSRQPLHIPGETCLRVHSLSLPEPAAHTSPEDLMNFEAIRLFAERARNIRQGFAVTAQNAESVVSLCHQLEGIPLAIELAAARMNFLSLEQIAARLTDRLSFLRKTSREEPARQQTLEATIDWSYDLLTAGEKFLFHRLSVFRGGFTLEAAEQVCVDQRVRDDEFLDLLSGLVDKSLVHVEEGRDEKARYRILEAMRQYGWEHLRKTGEAETILALHHDYFLSFAETAEARLSGPEQKEWLDQLELEHDNLRASMNWCAREESSGHGLRFGGALWRFWIKRGYLSEGREWLSRFLRESGKTRTINLARCLEGSGELASCQGDFKAARRFYEESLAIYEQLENSKGAASLLLYLGTLAYEQGDPVKAGDFLEKSFSLFEKLKDEPGMSKVLGNLGIVAWLQGDYAKARSLYEDALGKFRKSGEKTEIAKILGNLGLVAYETGDHELAEKLYEESLVHFRELGNRRRSADLLNSMGHNALLKGDLEKARSCCEESLKVFRDAGDRQGIAYVSHTLGLVHIEERDFQKARSCLNESLKISKNLRDKFEMAWVLEAMAKLADSEKEPEKTARLLGCAETLRRIISFPLPNVERLNLKYDQLLSGARGSLGEEAFERNWLEGCRMAHAIKLEEVISGSLGGES